eukprot:NODE_1079_length_1480_cov_47.355506_g1068_i0.p1 GENE.NODE_1079_length_1480_cov_47.355506_g1068_i0~~NODE_1079_length_1480_cov_47.355506_g1068_i0.p1  ORF type:complete len:456 (-),score=191.30 NODE_1079_length_1480_cov_47.355506_g1068_i0:112-1416(-)
MTDDAPPPPPANKNKRYRKDKPWDHEGIDHWKPVEASADNPLPPPVEESSFATLFPAYREAYLRECWGVVTRALKAFGVRAELNLLEGSMTVFTTRKMFDPYAIVKARDCIKLLSRSVPVQHAVKIMEDDKFCDIIKIKNMTRNKERFVKRRQRLIGPNGSTLKAIELVTDCYVMVQGNTVSAIGGIKGLKKVRRIIEGCIKKNQHPIYMIKSLMIQNELAKDETLKNEDWSRFLPQFKKRTVQRKKKPKPAADGKKKKKKKEYTPFPPEQLPRKEDLQIETGEYFLNQEQREAKRRAERLEKREAARAERRAEQQAQFTAPEESDELARKAQEQQKKKRKRKRKRSSSSDGAGGGDGSAAATSGDSAGDIDIDALRRKFQKNSAQGRKHATAADLVLGQVPAAGADDDGGSKQRRKKDKKDKKKKKKKKKQDE